MEQVIQDLHELRQVSGNAQIDLLAQKKNDVLRQVLEYTYDTTKKYKIDENKFNRVCVSPQEKRDLTLQDWNKYTQYLDKLVQTKSAKDADIQVIKSFIYSFNQHEFLTMVLLKDLRLGLNVKKIQKVWSDFCVTYPYMGCRPFNMKNLQNIQYPAFAQTKMDGTFCNVIVDFENKKVEYISRQSKPQPIQGSLDAQFLNIQYDNSLGGKLVFTGEILVWDNEKNKPLPRKLSNGIIRREDKTQDELNRIHFVCWDFIPYDKFLEKQWDVPYCIRFQHLSGTFFDGIQERLHLVNSWIVLNVEEAMKKFDEEYAKGEEGVVIKSMQQIWQDGKPAGQVKIKAEKDCDLKMVAFYEGKGNYSGMCGSIKCVTQDELLEVMVKPRTPEDAKEIWYNQDKYINKILTVKYNEKIESDTKDKPSLYLPVFVEIRDDKIVADQFKDIQ